MTRPALRPAAAVITVGTLAALVASGLHAAVSAALVASGLRVAVSAALSALLAHRGLSAAGAVLMLIAAGAVLMLIAAGALGERERCAQQCHCNQCLHDYIILFLWFGVFMGSWEGVLTCVKMESGKRIRARA